MAIWSDVLAERYSLKLCLMNAALRLSDIELLFDAISDVVLPSDREVDPTRLRQRLKQLQLGKNTPGYTYRGVLLVFNSHPHAVI